MRDLHLLSKFGLTKPGRDSIDGEYKLFTGRQGFPGGSDGNMSACNVEDLGSIAGSGRSLGKGNGNPLQYSWLENSMYRGAWRATVCGTAELDTTAQLNTHTISPGPPSHFSE